MMDRVGWAIVAVAVFQGLFGLYLGWLMWGRKLDLARRRADHWRTEAIKRGAHTVRTQR